MGKERLVAGGSGHESAITQSRNLPEISRRRFLKLFAIGATGLGVAAFVGCQNIEGQDSTPTPCSSETIKYPPDLEREYLVPCKRLTDFIPPPEYEDPVSRLKWLEEEVEKINSGGAAFFANDYYAVGLGDSIIRIWERPLPVGSIGIEVASVKGPDDFKNKKEIAIHDLETFFGQPLCDVLPKINLVWNYREEAGISLEQHEALLKLGDQIYSTPGCKE